MASVKCGKCEQWEENSLSMRRVSNAFADFEHVKCPDMSETKENPCPECGHPAISHCNPTETNIPGCLQHISVKNYGSQRCPCTRSYESLVGEKRTLMQCIHCKLISSDNNPVEECKVSACHDWGVFTPDALPESAKDEQVAESKRVAYAQSHGLCDHCGSMAHKTGDAVCNRFDKQVANPTAVGMDKPELQLLVIDMGDCCVVRVERNNHQPFCLSIGDRNYQIGDGQGNCYVLNDKFSELRDELDGRKPVPRVELSDVILNSTEGNIKNCYVLHTKDSDGVLDATGHQALTPQAYDALSELAGKPLPIYEGGKWEELIALQSKNEYGNWIDEREFTAWRYTR